MIMLIIIFSILVAGLIWGRLYFFKISGGTRRSVALAYDSAVILQVVCTYYFLFTLELDSRIWILFAAICYLCSIAIFWWAIFTAKELDFAFSNRVGSIVTTGPFRFVRHPFYLSYVLAWIGNSLLFNSLILWITLFYLMTFYFLSAKKEEKVILKSVYSKEYEQYIQEVGMFLPRVIKWMPSDLKP